MKVFLVNPSDDAFGTAVITPRWLFVLAAATPDRFGQPIIVDETIEALDLDTVQPGDVVGIGIHTANALRGLKVGRLARERGAWVVFGGIHTTLFPEEPLELGGAHASVKGDGDEVWAKVLTDCQAGKLERIYDGGRVSGDRFMPARWDLVKRNDYMWASVQTVRGCPKHCSFCSVWRTDGQKPRQRGIDAVIREIVELRRMGYRFVALADDNFYPVSMRDIELAAMQKNDARVLELESLRAERFELMRRMKDLPSDMVFFTQITMEAAEDIEFLKAMEGARIRGALVGVEAVTEEGLKSIFKDFNLSGDSLAARLRTFRENGVHVLGSFIFGLPTDREDTFKATAELAKKADITFAQFVTMTPYPGTVDFQRWEKDQGESMPTVEGVPLNRYWLIPSAKRPKLYFSHPALTLGQIASGTQSVWDDFYSSKAIWSRANCVKSLKARLAFFLISKLYRQMYANTGIATDSARRKSANRWARIMAKAVRKLFHGKPMPELQVPGEKLEVLSPLRVLG
jgi:radical SAM superfamily enzyme YgiQ (UPF0313 family)